MRVFGKDNGMIIVIVGDEKVALTQEQYDQALADEAAAVPAPKKGKDDAPQA